MNMLQLPLWHEFLLLDFFLILIFFERKTYRQHMNIIYQMKEKKELFWMEFSGLWCRYVIARGDAPK